MRPKEIASALCQFWACQDRGLTCVNPGWLREPRLVPRGGQSEDTEPSSLRRRPKDTVRIRTEARARATAGRSARLDRRTRTSHTTECSSRAMAAMRSERAETGKVSSPGHAKGPREHAREGSLGGWKPAANRLPAWKRPRAEGPGPCSPGRRQGHRGERLGREGSCGGGGVPREMACSAPLATKLCA